MSLKCVQHSTKPKKIIICIKINKKEPLFQAISCLALKDDKYNFLKKCNTNTINIISTPRSCNQKKSSVYKSSESSSSLDDGINIGSFTKLKATIIPDRHCITINSSSSIPNKLMLRAFRVNIFVKKKYALVYMTFVIL